MKEGRKKEFVGPETWNQFKTVDDLLFIKTLKLELVRLFDGYEEMSIQGACKYSNITKIYTIYKWQVMRNGKAMKENKI